MRKHRFEGLAMEEDATKIRKSRCSPSSSTSSFIHNHRPKKAALVRKRGGGSTTPVPTWRLVASRSPSISLRIASCAETPRSKSGRSTAGQMQQPVSARKLAATLWELNEVPAPAPAVKDGRRRRRERVESFSSLLPPHLSDPSHSPVSERSDRSGTETHRRRQSSSFSRKHRSNAHDIGVLDSVSNASFMEIETRCQSQTPAMSTAGSRNRLKDVNNALKTSKELLKIISRMWVQEDNKPSSSTSLMSALHTELERARLQVNQLVQEQRSEQNEINYLLQSFAEEKAAWRSKERESIRAATESLALELEAERKLRRRIESMNKKLGKELGETKALFAKAIMELEDEKRERADLAWNAGEDLKRESIRMRDEIEKEREMLHIADALREERAHMKLSEAKHHFEEKNAAVDQLRNELETFLKDERGEVEDGDESGESDLHSIELNMNRLSKGVPGSSKKLIADQEMCIRGQRRSDSLLRSVSSVVESLGDEKVNEVHRRSCGDDLQRSKAVKGLREHVLSSSRMGPTKNVGSPGRQWVPPWSGSWRRH